MRRGRRKTGRPAKPPGKRLVSVTFNVSPLVRDELDRRALWRETFTSVILREIVERALLTDGISPGLVALIKPKGGTEKTVSA